MTKDLRGRPIRRVRGDTAPDQIRVLGLDATGFTFLLTLNTVRNPNEQTGEQLLQIVGVQVAAGPPAVIQFPWTPTDADQAAGVYWYDIEQVDTAGRRRTLAKHRYSFDDSISQP